MELTKCGICGSEHDIASMQIGFARSDAELEIPEGDREKRCWGNKTDFLQIDDGRWFIRGWLPVPVVERDAPFAWGVWVEVSADDFWTYVRMYRDDGRSHPSFPGRIANNIAAYPSSLDLEVSIQLALAGDRPVVSVVDVNHPLGRDQQHGISVERVLALLHGV